jgi:hypothetical protein
MRCIDKKFDENGYFIQNSFINNLELELLNIIFEDRLIKEPLNENTAKLNYNEIYKYKPINLFFKKLKKFLKINIKYDFYLRNIWFIKTISENFRNDLPYLPHIDKKRYFKVFLYLNDISESDGAFTIACNSSVKENEKLRLNWWNNNLDNLKGDKHGLLMQNDKLSFIPIEMKSGSIVGFDTNVPHYAGKVKEGRVRKVLRFNFHIDYNTSKLSFLKQKSIAEISKNLNLVKSLFI